MPTTKKGEEVCYITVSKVKRKKCIKMTTGNAKMRMKTGQQKAPWDFQL